MQRLDQSKADNRTTDLVLAACMGDEVLEDAIDGAPIERPTSASAASVSATHAYIGAIQVEGFRGIGPQTRLALEPGPGLTLVVGRNGSGKSSFAEAAELLLTGENKRWSGRPTVWQEGWRNLHHASAAIEVELVADGQPQTSGSRPEMWL
ncbi:MAG: ATP-binding protein [Acidimicrobiia bacterium]